MRNRGIDVVASKKCFVNFAKLKVLTTKYLDPEAAQLDLTINASKVLNVSFRSISTEIASLIECAIEGRVARDKGVRIKLVGGQILPVEIPFGDAISANHEFTKHPMWNQLSSSGIDNVGSVVLERLSNRHYIDRLSAI